MKERKLIDEKKRIKSNIKKILIDKNLTARDVSRKMGKYPDFISQELADLPQKSKNIDFFIRLSDVLKVKLENFFK